MTHLLTFGLAAFFTFAQTIGAGAEQAVEAPETPPIEASVFAPDWENLSDFLWVNRPVIVFADSPNDPRFAQQMDLLRAQADDLDDRDIVVLTDTDPDLKSALRKKLRPRGFMLVLIGKDGAVKLRKPLPWNVRELSRVIDKMPMRQREIREKRAERRLQ